MSSHKKIDLTFAKRLEQIMIERQIYPAQVAKITGLTTLLIGSDDTKAIALLTLRQFTTRTTARGICHFLCAKRSR